SGLVASENMALVCLAATEAAAGNLERAQQHASSALQLARLHESPLLCIWSLRALPTTATLSEALELAEKHGFASEAERCRDDLQRLTRSDTVHT
ncbi:MAG TPA: hypothetical protein VMF89_15285, partial [Polyangiales bacterium]|nr:hypothetical protein [Polyangiales bacterium]